MGIALISGASRGIGRATALLDCTPKVGHPTE